MRLILLFLLAINASLTLIAEEEWSQFRGPEGNGHSASRKLPVEWDENQNISWKTAIHDRGWSSPVIWRNQIWLTTSTQDGQKLFAVCVNRETGKIIHDIPVFDVERPQVIAEENSYASPTPVIEEGRVYVHYGTYGSACLDTSTGDILWTRRDLNCDHEDRAGPNSSPFLVGNLFVVNVDGRDVQYVIALDKTNGKTVWKTIRSENYEKVAIHQRKAYTMPILIPRGEEKQLVSPGAQAIYSYNPDSGEELWKVRHRGWSIAPRPVFGNELVFVVMDHDHPELWAICPDGKGDVTNSHVQWKATRGIPARSSPLLIDGLLYLVNRQGIVTCLDALTGKQVWKNRIKGKYSASPVYANKRIYFFNESGATTVINPGNKFKIIKINQLAEDRLMASPAIAGNSLIIRTEKSLYCIEESSN